MKKMKCVLSAALMMGGLWIGAAQAAPTYCSALPNPAANADGLETGDVTFRGSSADDCYGVVTNPNNDSLTAVNNANLWGGGWQTMARDNKDGGGDVTGSLLGLNWSISASGTTNCWFFIFCNTDNSLGSFSLTVTDPAPASPVPVTMDMMIVLKGSDRWAAYFIDSESFGLGSTAGTWDIEFKNNGGRIPDLSHISLYLRSDPGQQVPEPSSLALLGLGLAGLVAARRRRVR
jgi:hypothetical protein